jgi:hypothetical protein
MTGIGVFKASCPAAVMQYTSRPLSSECRSIHPFATMPAMVCLPAGRSSSLDSPFVTLIRCRADLSFECGMWLGLGGIFVLDCTGSATPQGDLVSPERGNVYKNSAN